MGVMSLEEAGVRADTGTATPRTLRPEPSWRKPRPAPTAGIDRPHVRLESGTIERSRRPCRRRPPPMDPVTLLLRWAHILGAVIALGGLFFARVALLPAVEELGAETSDRVHTGIRHRWLPWVLG